MKKIILAAAVLLISTSAFAQMDWGIKGGFNLASMTKDSDANFKFSFHAGAFMEFKINDFFSVQPELMYSRQGWKMKGGGTEVWARMNYLNLPVLAKLYVLDGLSVELGPQFGYLLNAKVKMKEGGTTTTNKFKDDCKDFDVSFAMGAGYKITSHFDVYFRYLLGLTKTLEVGKHKNSVIQFGVGYRF